MNGFEYKDYFDSNLCFRGDEEKVIAILDSYAQNKIDLNDVNKVFELYHTKLFFDKFSSVSNWSDDKYNEYKSRTLKLKDVVHNFYKHITPENIIDIFKSCYVTYWNDFRKFFYMFKIYHSIPKERIGSILKDLNWNINNILENKAFVEYFDAELTQLLQDSGCGSEFVISYYLEEQGDTMKVHVPKSFTVDIRLKLVGEYLANDDVNPRMLQLIIDAPNNKELPISAKIKKLADEKRKEFWEKNESTSYSYGFCISFGKFEQSCSSKKDSDGWHFEYDTRWIKEHTDYPTLLNNFIYLFEFVNQHMLFSFLPNQSNQGTIESVFSIKGKNMYKINQAFNMLDLLTDAQLTVYVNELRLLSIDIENIIKWFFKDYLKNEFLIENYICHVPEPTDSILSKCKTLASAIDGIVSQYKMLCDDGFIDKSLFKFITDSPKFKGVPSLIKNKYCYIKNPDLNNEIYLIFSDQSHLRFTKITKARYETFFNLINNEDLSLDDFHPCNQESLELLLNRKVIYLDKGIIRFNSERVGILLNFYKHDVIALQHYKSSVLKELIRIGDVRVGSTLLSEPEYHYFNYLLNNSEYSNGKALRNRYIHDSVFADEETMNKDYHTLLKVMILLIIKINDDCCVNNDIEKKGDFYEL